MMLDKLTRGGAAGLCTLAVIAIATACTGRPVPLSAQAGSTILLPLAVPANTVVGFGGAEWTDYQRGELVFRLGGPTGMELVTRATSAVAAAPHSALARLSLAGTSLQIVSLVDIPANAPLGTHSLHVVRRRIENGTPVEYSFPSYAGELIVLPNEVTAGSEVVTGAPTPFEICSPPGSSCTWSQLSSENIRDSSPDPELRINLSANMSLWAVEMTVSYPDDQIEIRDVLEPPVATTNDLASVWYTLPAAGVIQIKAVAEATAFSRLSVVFRLLGDAAIAPADVDVTIDKAFNASGNPVSPSVVSKLIF